MQNLFLINNFLIQIYTCKSYNTRFVDAWAPPPIMRKNLILTIVHIPHGVMGAKTFLKVKNDK